MGIVYEGRDPNLDRRVAIKTVKVENLSEEAAAEYEARFRTEARSAARLQHPNIVSVYDSDRDGDIAFLVMEYIQGDDLKHHLDHGVRYSLEQVLKMIRDLLSALDYAHKQGIVHRDIKPANLLIEPGGRVKLTDFGVARIQDSGEATRTQGSMVGTLKYMSPEQVQGQKIDSRADLFSVGVVLYQLLTDKRPFDGDNDFSIIHQIIGHTPPPPSSFNARLPPALDAVMARGLAKDREQRFTTARDFAAALQSAIRRAEDATVVPPANPFKKSDAGGTGSKAGLSVPGTGMATSGTSGSTATVTQELELVYWKDIKDSTDPEELDGFLVRFPEGIYADLARRRLRKLAGGVSTDQTGLGVGASAFGEQDLEATRVRSDLSQPALPAAESPVFGVAAAALQGPATAAAPPILALAGDLTRTLVEPRGILPQAVPEVLVVPVAVPPPPAAQAKQAPAAVQPARKKPLFALLAGSGVVAVTGLAALLTMGKGGEDMVVTPASAPQPAASQPAPAVVLAAVSAPAVMPPVGAPPPGAAVPVKPELRPAAVAGAPSKPASASRPKRVEVVAPATVAAAPVEVQPAAAPVPREEARPVASASRAPRPMPPAETCKDRIFLAKQFCLQTECANPVFQNAMVCVQMREEAKMREDSKIRN